MTTSAVLALKIYSPCLLVAEFLRYHFAQLQSQPISYFLGQVVVRAPAKKHDVRHVRKLAAAHSRTEKKEELKKYDTSPHLRVMEMGKLAC